MDMIELIKNRCAIRQFSSTKLDKATIEKILSAGQFAPSPLNSQPWHFTIVQNTASLKNLATTAQHASFIADAPLLIIVTVDNNTEIDEWLLKHKQHIYSAATAMQNMWLASWSLGIGCCWVTLDELTTKHIISLPDNHTLIGSLSLGYMKNEPNKQPKTRKPLASMISYESYGLDNDTCTTVSCHSCMKIVSKSSGYSPEGEDYIRYYCGPDCYEQWRNTNSSYFG